MYCVCNDATEECDRCGAPLGADVLAWLLAASEVRSGVAGAQRRWDTFEPPSGRLKFNPYGQ